MFNKKFRMIALFLIVLLGLFSCTDELNDDLPDDGLNNWQKIDFSYDEVFSPVYVNGKLFIHDKYNLHYSLNYGSYWGYEREIDVHVLASDAYNLYTFYNIGCLTSLGGSKDVRFSEPLQMMLEDRSLWPGNNYRPFKFTHAKSVNSVLSCSGIMINGEEHELRSNDQGITWYKGYPAAVVDIANDQYIFKAKSSTSSAIGGKPYSWKQDGVNFYAVEAFLGDYYFFGATNNKYEHGNDKINRGIIIKNDANIRNALILPERLNDAEVFNNQLVVVGEKGAIYVLK